MELAEILRTLWRRAWLIALITLVAAGATFAVSLGMTPIYQATVTMAVDQSANAPLDYRSITTGENLALTYSQLLKTRPVLETAIANLGLDLSPGEVKGMLRTELVPDTQLLELIVRDTSPERARDIANEVAITFVFLHNTEKQLEDIANLKQDVVDLMQSLKGRIENNQSSIEGMSASAVPFADQEMISLQTAMSSQQSAYAGLLATYLNIQLTESQFYDVRVVEPAIASHSPVRPDIPLYTLVGAFLGLNCGVGAAFMLEHLDRSIKTSEAVRELLSLPVLGSIPRLSSTALLNGLVSATLPNAPSSEAFRTLRTNLRFASVDEPIKTLLVTSPDSGTGKTTMVANLGVVCAQAGLRVVLLDADLRRPSLHKQFGLENGVGLTDLLVGDVQGVTDCMVPTRISGLSLVPSGAVPPNPSELLGSARMGIVLAEVQELADLVLLDSPPTLLVADAAVLARIVDRVLLVLRAGETRRDAARQALDNLAQVGGRVIGTVLNAISVRRGSAYYRYYSEGRTKQGSKLGRGSVPIIRRTWQWVAEKAGRNGHTSDTASSRTKAKVLQPTEAELADDRSVDD
jgi:succinoglycan biosynthesis transport protein ExoP